MAVIFYAGIAYFQLSEMRDTSWLAFHTALKEASADLERAAKLVRDAPEPELMDPAERPVADGGKAGTQPKTPAKDKQTATGKKTEKPVAIGAQPSPAKQPGPGADEAAREQQRESVEINRQVAKYTGQLAALTFWLVVVTLVLGIAAGVQAWIARDTEKRQLRAYVVVQKATVMVSVQATGSDRIATARVTFLNAGQTPAYELEHRRSIKIGGLQQRPVFSEAEPSPRTMAVLGPKVEHPDDLGKGFTINNAQWQDLVNGGAIYFWGEVTYRDIFKKRHRTPFAVRYPRIVSKLDDPSTTGCPDGNDPT